MMNYEKLWEQAIKLHTQKQEMEMFELDFLLSGKRFLRKTLKAICHQTLKLLAVVPSPVEVDSTPTTSCC